MNGIELFDSNGFPLLVRRVTATRTNTCADNLINGMNLKGTADDMFTAALIKDNPVELTLDFGKPFKLAMVRFWNYWTDRQQWKKGAKVLSLHLDNNLVFAGSIGHCTDGKSIQNRHDFILFTQDPAILEKVGDHDWLREAIDKEESEIDDLALKDLKTGLGVQLASATSARFKLERNSSRKSKIK